MNFSNIRGSIKKKYKLAALTWFKVGGEAEVFFKPADLEDLVLFLKQNSDYNPLKSLNTTGSSEEISNHLSNSDIKQTNNSNYLYYTCTNSTQETSIAYNYSYLSHLYHTTDIFPITVLGAGSNIIIRDYDIPGVVIKLTKSFCDIEIYKDFTYKGVDFSSMLNNHLPSTANQLSGNSSILLSVGTGCLNYNLAKFALSNSITDLEFIACIPGSIGGGIAMNAGAYGKEFKNIVVAVEAIDIYGNIYILLRDQIGFEYRKNNLPKGLIYTKAILQASYGEFDEIKKKMDYINESRKLSQPIGEKTGGSSFANPEISIKKAFDKGYVDTNFISKFTNDGDDLSLMPLKAWQLIDYAGLRGKKIGNAEISNKHCNFMVNHGNATAEDIENLGNHIQKAVECKTGITLKWEIKRIGRSRP